MPARGFPAWQGFDMEATPWKSAPKPALCTEWNAWGSLLAAAPRVEKAAAAAKPLPLTYTYDLVDVGREVLQQLTIPLSLSFSAAARAPKVLKDPCSCYLHNDPCSCYLHKNPNAPKIQPPALKAAAALYSALLLDLNRLLATDGAFLLGPWLASARKLGTLISMCVDSLSIMYSLLLFLK